MFETRWLDIAMGRTRVRVSGSGPAIMFTHGLLVDGRIWDEVATAVAAEGFTVVLPDLPLGAHSVAVADRAKLTTTGIANCLFDIADQLGINRFSALGFDTGGAVSQVAAASRPERIERLALMSCDAFEHYPPLLIKPFKWAARWSPAMSLILKTLSDVRYQHIPLPLGLVAKHHLDQVLAAAWSEPSRTNPEIRADVVSFIKQMNATDTLAASEALRTFHGPAMVMWSREEKVFPRKDAHRLAALIPGCELRWIDDAYTFASLDNPKRMIQLILEFLNLPISHHVVQDNQQF
jgi:pimeloyl-ACP methyl ester carboxylesterase